MAKAHIADALIETALVRWDRPCLLKQGSKTDAMSGAQFFEETTALSRVMREMFGQAPSAASSSILVGALLRNSPDYISLWLASCAAGGVFVPLNWRWTAKECAEALETTGTVLLVHDDLSAPLAKAAASACLNAATLIPISTLQARAAYLRGRHPDLFGLSLGPRPPAASLRSLLQPVHADRDVALVCFTSGTTGRAKAAAISHRALIFQSQQKLKCVHYSASDVYLHTAPLFHIGGASSCHANLLAGALHVFPDPSVPTTPAMTLEILQGCGVTSMISVPAMIVDLIRAAEDKGVPSLPSLQKILVGAGTMTPQTLALLFALCPHASLHTAYGMTEAASSITFHHVARDPRMRVRADPTAFLVGTPPEGIHVRVAAGADRSPAGQGEVQVYGPNLMSGYLVGAPGVWRLESLGAWTEDGWLRTGDVGLFGEGGVLFLRGREKDMIKSGGENVFAGEVETVLSTLAGCRECAVVGTPDARLGEAVTAVLVRRAGGQGDGTLSDVAAHCKDKGLAGFKVPKRLVWTDEALPRNSMGKVDKRALLERVMVQLEKGSAAAASGRPEPVIGLAPTSGKPLQVQATAFARSKL